MPIFFILPAFIIITGFKLSAEQYSDKLVNPTYPGVTEFTHCRKLWNSGNYTIDVDKCEKSMANSTYKIGSILTSKNYPGCLLTVVSSNQWSSTNEALYRVKINCGTKKRHNKLCEEGRFETCPSVTEGILSL